MNFEQYLDVILTPQLNIGFETVASWTVEGSWDDVAAKAVRLIQSGNVSIIHNSPTYVMANVRGDHGDYDCEISRHDPNSSTIEQWSCTCPWNQFAWDRTRQWKYMEGRCCSHVLATYWRAKSTPLDVEDMPAGYQAPAGQKQEAPAGQMTIPVPGQPIQAPPEPISTPDFQGQQPVIDKKDIAIPMQPPSQFGVLPRKQKGPQREPLRLFDVTAPAGQGFQPTPLTPTSQPGAAQPSPQNPVIFPGTFSRVESRIIWAADGFEQWVTEGLARGANPVVTIIADDLRLELRGGKQPMPDAMPIDVTRQGVPTYNIMDLGYNPETDSRINSDQSTGAGPGAPELRGQHILINRGTRAEVRAIEPYSKTILIAVPLFTPALHAKEATDWVDYTDVKPAPGKQTPFRA